MTAAAVTILAYALGCVATGYYIVRLMTGEDLRAQVTGSTGARNVGRRLGVAAAVATFAADVAKGAIAVGIALAAAGGGAAPPPWSRSWPGTSRRSSSGSGADAASGRPSAGCSCSTGGWRLSRWPRRRSRPRRPARSPRRASSALRPRRSRRSCLASAGPPLAAGVTAAIVLAAHARRRPDQLQG